jgi:hypothetical protein
MKPDDEKMQDENVNETALDVFMRLIRDNPRFKEAKPEGKAFEILGARPPTKPKLTDDR